MWKIILHHALDLFLITLGLVYPAHKVQRVDGYGVVVNLQKARLIVTPSDLLEVIWKVMMMKGEVHLAMPVIISNHASVEQCFLESWRFFKITADLEHHFSSLVFQQKLMATRTMYWEGVRGGCFNFIVLVVKCFLKNNS